MASTQTDSTKKFVDFTFANQTYGKFRPDYPDSLYEEVLKRIPGRRHLCVDVGCGTGQASVPLAKHFTKVLGYDPSPGQIEQAPKDIANLEFRQGTAEDIDVPPSSVDLIIAAQAVHWFSTESFYAKTTQLLRVEGLLALWGYGLCSIDNPQLDKLFQDYYYNQVGPYFAAGREHLDNEYKTIVPFGYDDVERVNISMAKPVDFAGFTGYMTTWSGLNAYKKAHPDREDPLEALLKKMHPLVGESGKLVLTFPVFMIFARNKKQ